MTTPDYRALCAELVEQLQRAISEHGFSLEAEDALMYRARTALAQPEPEGPPAVMTSALLHPAYEPDDGSADGAQMVGMAWWRPVMGCDSLQLVVDNARNILRSRWGRPAIEPVPVSDVRYEFIVSDAETDEPQASGEASTLEEAQREGRHYLAMYEEDGPMRLELRRVEVLPHHALPVPEVTP